MAKPPRRPRTQSRKSGLTQEAVASRAVVPRKRDRRQSGLFDAPLPAFVRPQLSKLVREAPDGDRWAHELKYDGYRMHARIDAGRVQLLTRTGLDWTAKYASTADALRQLPIERAYIDGELCAVRPDGTTSFSLMQAATDAGSAAGPVFFAFDLLHLNGEDLTALPLLDRKERLADILKSAPGAVQYSDHVIGHGEGFFREACKVGAEGVVSKLVDAPYRPDDRGTWLKVKCLNREEFIVVGWTDPEGRRPHLGALLLAYYAPDGRLV
jgi:DNA ligase D-like protein (predicted ligase)